MILLLALGKNGSIRVRIRKKLRKNTQYAVYSIFFTLTRREKWYGQGESLGTLRAPYFWG